MLNTEIKSQENNPNVLFKILNGINNFNEIKLCLKAYPIVLLTGTEIFN